MPTFKCIVRADLDGIESICPTPDRTWMLKFICGKCGSETPNFIEVDPSQSVKVGGGTSNCSFKCKECKNIISVTVVPKTEQSFTEAGGPVVQFDVRGGEPCDLLFDDSWSATGAGDSATVFQSVDLSDDYADYDEREKCPVMISNPTVTFK